MKKVLMVILTVLIVLGLASSALAAADSSGVQTPVATAISQAQLPRIINLQGYDQLLQLRSTAKTLKAQNKTDQSQLQTLVQDAKQTHGHAALKALQPFRATLKQSMADLKSQQATQKNNWQAMKHARQANDTAQIQTIMNQILTTRQAINADLSSIGTTLEQMIQSLQSQAPTPTTSNVTNL